MGLDVHFYNRKKIKPEYKANDKDILQEITDSSNNTELLKALKSLKEYALLSKETLDNCLIKAINSFVEREYSFLGEQYYNEVAYFRKFWWVLDYFGYSDSDYSNDKPVTKEQLENAKNLAEKTIRMIIKHFTDKGFEIEQSPLDYVGKTARWGGVNPTYLSFKNCILNDELEEEADQICYSIFDCDDSFIFYKVCEMYVQFSEILRNTNFDNEIIVLNADW